MITMITCSVLAVPVYEVGGNIGTGIGMKIGAVGTSPEDSDLPIRWYWTYGDRFDINFEKVFGSDDITDGSDWTSVSGALDTWEAVSGASAAASPLGGFDGDWGALNGDNEIGWVESDWTSVGNFNFSENAIAVTVSWYDTATFVQLETDIFFNGEYFSWYTDTDDSGSEPQFVGHIALHELGHAFSLTDLYDSVDSTRTMYGYGGFRNEDTTLHPGDEAALEYAYPVPEPMTITFFALAGLFFRKKAGFSPQ